MALSNNVHDFSWFDIWHICWWGFKANAWKSHFFLEGARHRCLTVLPTDYNSDFFSRSLAFICWLALDWNWILQKGGNAKSWVQDTTFLDHKAHYGGFGRGGWYQESSFLWPTLQLWLDRRLSYTPSEILPQKPSQPNWNKTLPSCFMLKNWDFHFKLSSSNFIFEIAVLWKHATTAVFSAAVSFPLQTKILHFQRQILFLNIVA